MLDEFVGSGVAFAIGDLNEVSRCRPMAHVYRSARFG